MAQFLPKTKATKSNIEMNRVGFELALEGLTEVIALCQQHKDLKSELKEWNKKGYNPFKKHGFTELEKLFRGWKRAFQKELKDLLGRRSYDKAKK